MYFYFYQAFMILSLVMSLFVTILIWRRRFLPAAPSMIALGIATFVWTLGFLLEANSATLGRQLFFNNIAYMGSLSVPVAWFVFTNNYTNSIKFIQGWRLISVCVIPLIIAVLVWTNDWHRLMWSNEHLAITGSFTVTAKTYGPFFWLALTYNYLLLVTGGIILIRRLFVGTPLYARQAFSLLFAVLLPWIWNAIYVFNLVPLPRKDLTPVMFAISGVAVAFGLLRYHLFTTVPFARDFIIQQLHDGVFVFDVRDCLAEANPMALKTIEADKKIIGKKLDELASASTLFRYLATRPPSNEELTLEAAGKNRIFEVEITPMTMRNQPAGWLAILHDVTEHRKSEEKYRLVAENSADIIYKLNLQSNRYTYVSPSVKQVLGYTEQESLTMSPEDVLTPESFRKQHDEMLKDLQAGNYQNILELDAVHKDGRIIPIEVHGSFVCDENDTPVEIVGVVRNITARRDMEKQLMVQDRLASIGQLISGVAHELNNPLTSVINFSKLLLKRDLPEDVHQDVTTIYEDAQRTAHIIKNLLTFAGKQQQEKEPVNIIEGIKKVLELRTYEQKVNNIRVNIHADPEMPMIRGNLSQLQQVFFNIIINAEYFMLQAHSKGTLTITAEKAGDAVRVTFADDGPGIAADDLKHVFEPFFTTKEQGKGTGLSLSICLAIISEHGGKIWAESEPGKGSAFIIELPAYAEKTPEGED